MNRRFLLLFAVALTVFGCRRSADTPRDPEPLRIDGSERLAWTQTASDQAELISLRYAAYVDGTRSELCDSLCASSQAETGFECSSSLPPMSPGVHKIELVAFYAGFEMLESTRSPAIQVQLTGTSRNLCVASTPGVGKSASQADDSTRPAVAASESGPFKVELVVDGLADPTDVAFAPDGSLFVSERSGRIRLVRNGILQPEPAASLAAVSSAGEGGLLGLAVDPQFARNRYVCAVLTAPAGWGAVAFRVVRLRHTEGRLVDPVVLLDGVPASATRAAASIRFGPDGKLYVALDDGGNAGLAGDMGSFNGKILRLNPDGSTPSDQAAATPVYSSGHRSPRGLAWQPGTDALWVADNLRLRSQQLCAVGEEEGRQGRARILAAFALPPGTAAAGMSYYSGKAIPTFRDDLFVAATTGGPILRIRFDPQDPLSIVATERILEGRVENARAVVVGPDGALYFCTDRVVARLVPDAARKACIGPSGNRDAADRASSGRGATRVVPVTSDRSLECREEMPERR